MQVNARTSAEDIARVPKTMSDFGAMMRNGELERLAVPRRTGNTHEWETSTMYGNAQVWGERAVQ